MFGSVLCQLKPSTSTIFTANNVELPGLYLMHKSCADLALESVMRLSHLGFTNILYRLPLSSKLCTLGCLYLKIPGLII